MKFAYILVAFVCITACNNSSEKEEVKPGTEEKKTPVVKDGEYDELMAKIDLDLPNLTRIESLIYHKEDGSSVSATAYLDQNNLITKIEEEQISGGGYGSMTKFSYYSNGGVLFASKRAGEKIKNKTAYFSEEISFYSPDGNVKESKERTGDFEEYIDTEEFRKIDPIKHSNDRALRILHQKGEFLTTFQGFVESGAFHFLIVGENVPNGGYTASLSIQEDNPTLRYLRKEGKNALGKELQVEFEKYLDGQGYIMQILKSVALVERKKS